TSALMAPDNAGHTSSNVASMPAILTHAPCNRLSTAASLVAPAVPAGNAPSTCFTKVSTAGHTAAMVFQMFSILLKTENRDMVLTPCAGMALKTFFRDQPLPGRRSVAALLASRLPGDRRYARRCATSRSSNRTRPKTLWSSRRARTTGISRSPAAACKCRRKLRKRKCTPRSAARGSVLPSLPRSCLATLDDLRVTLCARRCLLREMAAADTLRSRGEVAGLQSGKRMVELQHAIKTELEHHLDDHALARIIELLEHRDARRLPPRQRDAVGQQHQRFGVRNTAWRAQQRADANGGIADHVRTGTDRFPRRIVVNRQPFAFVQIDARGQRVGLHGRHALQRR